MNWDWVPYLIPGTGVWSKSLFMIILFCVFAFLIYIGKRESNRKD